MNDELEDWLDDALIADDPPSRRDWKHVARGGVDTGVALRGMPRSGQILCRVPIEQWRIFRDHCRARNMRPATFARQAIGMRMVAEGIDKEMIRDFLKPVR